MAGESFQLSMMTSTLAEQIAGAIFEAILEGKFTCGQHLTAAEIAEWLGVSRTPVREAFLILHRMRFLDKDTNRSFKVARWDQRDLMEVAQLRASLEELNSELVIPKMTVEDLDLLESIVVQMEAALSRRDYERLVQLDSQFHYTVWQIPGNKRLFQALEDLRPQIRYFMHITRPGDESDYPSMHREYLAVLKSGDVEMARKEIRDHILSTAERAIARLERSMLEEKVNP